jgi:hypothetical protein
MLFAQAKAINSIIDNGNGMVGIALQVRALEAYDRVNPTVLDLHVHANTVRTFPLKRREKDL